MGVYLGQLPPAEIARLKAELAETLIANFCYPRFFDYRTNSLRMRPVDRAKRQEVWLYLSSVDLTAWHRIDLMSQDLQYQIERLFVQFVQRNRSFFGEQGRKRMGDVRMLISSASTVVVDSLRAHISRQSTNNPPFGSPRPVISWGSIPVTGKVEPGWDQVANLTMLLQQQLQEVRGEVKASPGVTTTATATPPRRSSGNRVPYARPGEFVEGDNGWNGSNAPRQPGYPPAASSSSLSPAARSVTSSGNWPSPTRPGEHSDLSQPVELPTAPSAAVSLQSTAPTPSINRVGTPSQGSSVPFTGQNPTSTGTRLSDATVVGAAVQPRGLPVPPQSASVGIAGLAASQRETAPALMSDEDIAIFEQLRQQMFTWLRVEALQSGLDVSERSATQLIEDLRKLDDVDETSLQIASTLLDLSNQVVRNRQATVLDYKQGLMFHLMHTRPRRRR